MTSWFITRNGILFTRTIVGVAAAGIFSGQIALHGPLLSKYQKVMQMYKDGYPKQLPPDVLQIADLVLAECGVDDGKKEKVKFFTVIGRDLFHAGGISSPWGAIIGLPFTFEIKTKGDIDLWNMKVFRKEDFEWHSAEGDQLLQSLILSDNAKRFGIAREIFACDTQNIFVNAALSAFAILLPARIVQKSNKSGKAFTLPLRKRAMFYTVAYAVGFAICHCLKDLHQNELDKKCDRKAAGLGPEYLEGGIAFYDNILSKNKTLRNLMGSDGERMYDLSGNETYTFLAPLLPVSKRLEMLQKMKKEQNKNTDI